MPSKKTSLPDTDLIENIDPAIHAPARLKILAYLAAIESVDFNFLLNQTGLTRGNLATHIGRLEDAGYVEVSKEFVDKIPRTLYQLTASGKNAIQIYRDNMQNVINQFPE